jgi:hypothetical protein
MSVFNGDRYLPDAVDSILKQSVRDFEFIIIDDGSTDATPTILNSYCKGESRMRVYYQENRGQVDALNRGCALARGKYIARMDADDVAVRDRLKWQVEFMESHSQVGLVGGAVEFIDSSGRILRTARQPVGDRDIRRALLDRNVFWHPTAVFRREVFASLGGYRNVLAPAEDYDLWLRIADCSRVANLEEVLLKYRLHPQQLSVQRCRQQALGAAAARAAAMVRQRGRRDPLSSVDMITLGTLTGLGVNAASQQTTLARGYLSTLRNMLEIGEYALAFRTLGLLGPEEVSHADRWVVADLRLVAARLYWHQGDVAGSLRSAGRAIVMRPFILGRPLKRLLELARSRRRQVARAHGRGAAA